MSLYDAHQSGNHAEVERIEREIMVLYCKANGWDRALFAREPSANKKNRQRLIANLRDMGYD